MSWSRPLSPVERLWLVADRLYPPFVLNVVLEGDGSLDLDAWERAARSVQEAAPGTALVLRGALGWTRWVRSGALRVRRVDGDGWSGLGPEGAPFLQAPLDPWRGPTAEVLLVDGPTPRVVLRALHAVMDGGGMIATLDALFAALRQEALDRLDAATTDLVVAREGGRSTREPPPTDALAPTGRPDPAVPGVTWTRVSVPGAPDKVLGRVVCALAGSARVHGEGPVRVEVPVDLRRHRSGAPARTTGNLSGSVVVDVPADATPAQVQQSVKDQLAEGRHVEGIRATAPLRWFPLGLLAWLGRRMKARLLHDGRFGHSAVVSNMGRVDVGRWHGGGFTASRVWFLPPATPVTACFCGLSSSGGVVDVVLSVPRSLATDGRLEALADVVRSALQSGVGR